MNNILSEFAKPELIKIANELEIDLPDKPTAKNLIQTINDDLNNNGLPPEEDCSQLLEDYLYVAGFIGEDEDVPEQEPVAAVQVTAKAKQQEAVAVEDIKLPDCYTCADERDPACKRCKVFESCMAERINIRERELPCFGKLFDINAQECSLCLEAGPCKIALRDV